jgi:hypothetical protein
VFDGPSLILTLFMALIAGTSLVDVARNHRALFDDRFTLDERQRLMRFALFVLVPLSVMAHEGGHALFVKLFGGKVVGFGFYLYYGFVQHVGRYTPIELAWIAFAGTLVNVILAFGAIGWAWFRPGRAAVNYVLFIFGALEIANALIFYPLLDAVGGVAGDWETIYSRATPVFSGTIAVLHAVILVGGFILWRQPSIQRGYHERTGVRRVQPTAAMQGEPERYQDSAQRDLAGVLAVAAAVASNGWKHPVQITSDAQAGGSQVIVRWSSRGFHRALLVHATTPDDPNQHVEIHAAVETPVKGMPAYHRPLTRIDGHPNSQELVPYIRRFLDYVDTWDGATVTSMN